MTLALLFLAAGRTETEVRVVVLPPDLEIDFEDMVDDVFGAAWITLAPVSRNWPLLAKLTPIYSLLAYSPFKMLDG